MAEQKSPALVTLSNAGLHRSGRWLVRGVSLSLAAGEIVTLIGPNGSGKSTTVKMALGIHMPSEGSVTRQSGMVVSYVPQKLSIDWTLPLSAERFMQLTEPLSADILRDAMEETGVYHLRNAEVRNLSGGEFQRLMLARAIARKPDLLVLDEPVQGVDFAGEIALYDLIQSARDRLNCGVLLISHDLHMVMAATDHVVCLNGHVCCSGTPTNVATSDAYRTLFGTRAASGLAFYTHQHDHTHLPDGRVQHEDGTITDHCNHPHGEDHNHAG